MDDLISRQAAIKALEDAGMTNYLATGDFYGIINALTVIKNLPTSEKKGKWIDGNEGKWNAVYCPKCSVCGTPFYGIETVRYHYCPNCGAKMMEDDMR